MLFHTCQCSHYIFIPFERHSSVAVGYVECKVDRQTVPEILLTAKMINTPFFNFKNVLQNTQFSEFRVNLNFDQNNNNRAVAYAVKYGKWNKHRRNPYFGRFQVILLDISKKKNL